jgi:5-methylcytosine-specific restriction endonuclease McrA
MKKSLRIEVYNKFNQCCAYCGNYIEYDDMKIDHFLPQKSGGTDDISNLMPCCEICNHYKDSHNIHKFKIMMKNIKKKIEKLYIVKVAMRFGLIDIKEFKGFFYEKKDLR